MIKIQKVKQPRYSKYIYFPPVVVVGDVDVVVGDVDVVVGNVDSVVGMVDVVVGAVDSVVGMVDVVVEMVGINDASPVFILGQIHGQKSSMILVIKSELNSGYLDNQNLLELCAHGTSPSSKHD